MKLRWNRPLPCRSAWVVACLWACRLTCLALPEARAELLPEQVAVVATTGSEDSLRIAEYYVRARKLPPRNVFLLPHVYPDNLPRKTWNEDVRPQIKAWLETRPEVRCVVCCWDVPLRIGGYAPDAPEVLYRSEFLKKRQAHYRNRARELYREVAEVAATDASRAAGAELGLPEDFTARDWARKMESALKGAQARLQALPMDQRRAEATRLEPLFSATGGLRSVILALESQLPQTEQGRARDLIRGKVEILKLRNQGHLACLQALEALPESAARDAQILKTLEASGGIIAVLEWIDQFLPITIHNESQAAFDSELSLIFEEQTPLIWWVPNTSAWCVEKSRRRPTLMVARLEAPTVDIVIQMIDGAIQAEKTGLSGAVYLDARTPRPQGTQQPGSYAKMEQSLNDLGERLKKHTRLDVHLDTRGPLFTKADCAAPAALYCGWYSLASFQDTFTFVPGAVAYHIASSEAVSLKTGTYWCPNLLRQGAVATCGPTFEPYLAAFPEPDEFFSLLLTGEFTIMECYQFTAPLHSWAMTFVGDPLYNPFRERPQLRRNQLPETLGTLFEDEDEKENEP